MNELFLNYTELNEQEINKGFLAACRDGNLKAVKYLLTSDELPIKASIDCENNKAIYYACFYSQLEVVIYLLTNKDLKFHSDIYAGEHAAFKSLCSNLLNNKLESDMELFEYLVFNYQLKEDSELSLFLEEIDGNSLNNIILKRNLQNELSLNENLKKKLKV